MKNKVKVSVIMAAYNVETYIKQCLDSVCSQTLKDIEIICVDDGSTDHTLSILKDYQKRDTRIHIFSQKNQYAGVARNHGMKYAQGTYLSFLDADDYYAPDMLEKLYQKAEKQQLDVVICEYDYFEERLGKKVSRSFQYEESIVKEKTCFSGKELEQAAIFQITQGWAWDKLFLTDFVKKAGYQFDSFRSSEDGFFVYLLLARAERIGFIKEKLVVHRIGNQQSLSSTMDKNWINGYKMMQSIKEELRKQKLYSIFQHSFLAFALEFQLYYLNSMRSLKAQKNCFYYIKEIIEPDFEILTDMKQDLLFQEQSRIEYQEILENSFEEYLFHKLQKQRIGIENEQLKGWIFPYHLIEKGKRIILYGAGPIGRDYYKQLIKSDYCKEVQIVDRAYQKIQLDNIVVQNPEIVFYTQFDYILITIKEKQVQKEVEAWLLDRGIQPEVIKYFGQEYEEHYGVCNR